MYIRLWQNLLTADSKSEVKFLKVLMPHNRQSCNHSNWSCMSRTEDWNGWSWQKTPWNQNSYSYLHDNSNALHHFIPKAHNNCSCCNTIRNLLQWGSAAGRVRLSQRGVAYHSWSTRRCTLRIPGWPLSTVMFPPIKVVGGGHENLGLGAYGPPLFWHQGSKGTKELLVCAVSSSLLAGQDSSRVATWSCSGTRTMFILWVKGVIHPILMM